jgi:hypothetical protein
MTRRDNGVSPNQRCHKELLIYELTGEYTRSPAVKTVKSSLLIMD